MSSPPQTSRDPGGCRGCLTTDDPPPACLQTAGEMIMPALFQPQPPGGSAEKVKKGKMADTAVQPKFCLFSKCVSMLGDALVVFWPTT